MISPVYCGVGVGVVDGTCGGVCGTIVTCVCDRAAAFSAAASTGELGEIAAGAAASTGGAARPAGEPATATAEMGSCTVTGVCRVTRLSTAPPTAILSAGTIGGPAT